MPKKTKTRRHVVKRRRRKIKKNPKLRRIRYRKLERFDPRGRYYSHL